MIRQQMIHAVEQGIQGYIEACFINGEQYADPVTGYPLTAANSEVKFSMQYPYDTIVETFLNHMQWEESELNTAQLQAWAAYFWRYARLELQERFEPQRYDLTPEMEARREDARKQFVEQGYMRIW